MERRKLAVFILTALLVMSGCYPYDPVYGEEADLVVTKHDPDFDFTTLNSFALPDEVVKITGAMDNGEEVQFIDQEYADVILAEIRQNLLDDGWVETDAENADVIILPSAIQTTTEFWYYDYWYWDWWYPYNWWGWYYPYPIYGSYTTGTLFIQMTYPDGITAADNIPVIWTGILNGLLDGYTDDFDVRVEEGIDQAFDQSEYLDLDQD